MGLSFNSTLPAGLLPEADVDGMRQFLSTLIVPKVHSSFRFQMYASAVVVIFIAFLNLIVVVRRLRKRSAWVFQLYRTSSGTFIIPNAVMALVLLLFIFSVTYTVYAFISVQFYQHGSYQQGYMIWRSAPWYGLWCAAWTCGIGTISAFPDALRMRGRDGFLQRLFLRPSVFNAVLICGPLCCCASLLVPMLICNRLYNKIPARHHRWLEMTADPSASTMELAAEARNIWLEITRVYYYDSITFAVWVAWGGILFFTFSIIASHTLLQVRAQVKLAKRKKKALSGVSATFYLFSSRPNFDTSQDLPHVRPKFSADQPSLPLPVKAGTQSLKFAIDEQQQQRTAEPRSESATELIDVMQTETTSVLYPRLKPEPSKKLTRRETAARRSSALKLVYRNVLIQYAAISLGTASFSAIALYVACMSYPASRTNNLGFYQEVQNLFNCYSCLLFGATIVGAVAWRTLDPSFILGADFEEEDVEMPIVAAGPQHNNTARPALDDSGDTAGTTLCHSDGYHSISFEALSPKPVSHPPRLASPPPSTIVIANLATTRPNPMALRLAHPATAASVPAEDNRRSRYGAWRDG